MFFLYIFLTEVASNMDWSYVNNFVTTVTDMYNKITSQVAEVDLLKPITDAHMVLSDKVRKASYRLHKLGNKAVEKYNNLLESLGETVAAYVESVIDKEQIQFVQTALQEAYIQVNVHNESHAILKYQLPHIMIILMKIKICFIHI